jgi:hypothetical protein
MGISRFGKRYDEKLEAAKRAAEAEEERLRNLTPKQLAAERVTEAAENIETLEETALVVGKALSKALQEVERQKNPIKVNAGGWFEAGSRQPAWAKYVKVKATYDFMKMGIDVEFSTGVRGPFEYFIPDEVLNEVSATTVTFQEWVMRVGRALYVLLKDGAPLTASGNQAPGQVLKEACEQLEATGVRMWSLGGSTSPSDYLSEADEEARAIESIKKALES